MAKHMKGRKQIVSLSLDAELMDRIVRLADAQNRSRSAMIEELIQAGIQQQEIMTAALLNPGVAQTLMKTVMQPDVLKDLAKSIGETGIGDLEHFHQGLTMLNEFSKEYDRSTPPDVLAKRTVKRVGKSARKGK